MTTMVREIYEAFKAAGTDDDKAADAASAVVHRDELATKADLIHERAELKSEIGLVHQAVANVRADLTLRMVMIALGQTALIVSILRFFPTS